MKRLMVAIMVLFIGCAGYATAEDLMEKELRILADQYAAASSSGDTQLFASNFRSYMVGSNRLGAAAEQQRKMYQFSFDTSIVKFETSGDNRSYLVASADYESKKSGQSLAKGKITATYAVRSDKLLLVMVKFADEVVRYKDAHKLADDKARETDKSVIHPPRPNFLPDFSGEPEQERDI